MSKKLLGYAIAATLFASTSFAAEMKADEKMVEQEKCYGVNKTVSADSADNWLMVEKGKCLEMGGKLEAPKTETNEMKKN
jgi:uncharacterized membrane protein